MDVRVAIDTPALLGESPLWHPEQQALWYCDIPARRMHRFHPASGAMAHWDFHSDVGSFAPAPRRQLHRRPARRHLALRSGERRAQPARRRALRHDRGALQRRQVRPGRALLGRLDRRAASARTRRPLVLSRRHPRAAPVRDHDQQRPGVEPRRTHHVLGRHPRARRLGVRLRAAQRRHDRPARVRAVRSASRRMDWLDTAAGPTAPRSTSRAATGSRCTKARACCACRPPASCSPRSSFRRAARPCPASATDDLKTVYVTSASLGAAARRARRVSACGLHLRLPGRRAGPAGSLHGLGLAA